MFCFFPPPPESCLQEHLEVAVALACYFALFDQAIFSVSNVAMCITTRTHCMIVEMDL